MGFFTQSFSKVVFLLAIAFSVSQTVKADSIHLGSGPNSTQGQPLPSNQNVVTFQRIDPWDPFSEFEQEISRFFRSPRVSGFSKSSQGNPGSFDPDLDIQDTPKAYVIKVDLPGMEKDQIRLETVDQSLILSGERKSEKKEEGNGKVLRVERSFGSFHRVIPLPDEVKKEALEAKYENGVLTIQLPKKEEVAPKSQRISIS